MSSLQIICCLIFTSAEASVFSQGQEHVCETDNLIISCADSPNTTLYITCANFGRTSSETCYDSYAKSTDCIGSNTLLIVKGLCQNHVSCKVFASIEVFGDPCRDVSKYLGLDLNVGSQAHAFECHDWTFEDMSKFWINCTFEPTFRHSACEDHPGFIYTKGNETLAPGCGSCGCCKPTGSGSYKCHDWTYEDKAKFWVNCTHHPELEGQTCEAHPGFIFAQGNKSLTPGCSNCSCCKPKVSAPNNSVCLASSPNVFTTSINTKILQGTTVTNSTGSSTHVPRTIEDTSGFFDDPTNITLLIIAAGVAGLWAVLVIGYILVSYLIKNTSLCARNTSRLSNSMDPDNAQHSNLNLPSTVDNVYQRNNFSRASTSVQPA